MAFTRFRTALEIAATRTAAFLVPRLSRRQVLRWTRVLGGLGYALAVHERRTGRANLDLAFGDTLTPARKRAILRASFQHMARVILDIFWFSRDTLERLDQTVRFEDAARRHILTDRPQMLITGHFGNWEIYGQAISRAGISLMSVAAPLANPAVDRLFIQMRRLSGQQIVPKAGALFKLVKHLRRGGKVAMLLDQNTKPAEGGRFVPFFGLPVPVSAAAAALAHRTQVETCYVYCLTEEDGAYRACCFDPIPPPAAGESEGDPEDALTRQLTALTERLVRAYPEQWLWMYKRWKYVGPGRARNEYPFYAKTLPPEPGTSPEEEAPE